MESVERKSLINKSALGFWCVNHVQGCSHGCRYPCHAFMLARRHGRVVDIAQWTQPRLVSNALQILDRELRRKRQIDCVHMSLTTDPFMFGYPQVEQLTLQVVARINEASVPCSILTKGRLPADLASDSRYRRDNTYGISLVSLHESFRTRWEPGASPYAERIAALRSLHEAGCRTLVHIEPYPTPNIIQQDLRELLDQVAFVDHVFFGGWNYNPHVGEFAGRAAFYAKQAQIVRAFCAQRAIACEALA